jgi:hypothetical protein
MRLFTEMSRKVQAFHRMESRKYGKNKRKVSFRSLIRHKIQK